MGFLKNNKFIHLHTHTAYSLLDGLIKIDELINSCCDMKMDAIAMTDHGNIFGAVQFSQKAREKGIKPIIGCELYVAPYSRFSDDVIGIDGRYPYSHLVVLCENEKGYKNLSRLLTLAYQEGFRYKPRVDKELLSKYHEGLIASSACLGGEIPRKIKMGKFESALQSAQEFKEIFGKDNFFLEIQEHGLPSQKEVNRALIEISKKTGIPLIVTNDVHFLTKEDFEAHKVLLCIQTKTTMEKKEKEAKEAYTQEHYLKSPEEMYLQFGEFKDALLKTVEIAERCNFDFDFGTYHFPRFEVPEGYTLMSYFEELLRKGFEKKVLNSKTIKKEDIPKYVERLEYEKKLIVEMGFLSYFLIVSDFIKFAKENGIPVGPGRGSASGSLVSYCLDITDIDPIKYNLLFERFLNPERVTMPDIDIDFCGKNRDKVIEYVKERYGEENVARIITFGGLQAKMAIRDTGRVFGVSLKKVDQISKMVPVELGSVINIESAIKTTLKNQYEEDEEVRKILNYAKKLEALPRHAGVHAGGVVIAPEPIYNFCPLYKGSKGELLTQFEKDDIQAIGLLKIDFLSLKTMTIINETFEILRKSGITPPNLSEIPLDDEKTFEIFSSGNTDAVFQFESAGMKDALRRLKPKKFEQLIVLNALYRPGPLGAGILNEYIERAHHPDKVVYPLEELKPILEETLGLIVYQEQVMQIANIVAGFSLGEADLLRQAISKKNKEKMEVLERKFRNGARMKKYKDSVIDTLIEQIKYFGGYGFNKSHSAAYALIAYWTAYLLAHYKEAYMAATLSLSDKPEKLLKMMNFCRELGISLLPPDVNLSEEGFTLEKNAIRYGLSAIKNVGKSAVNAILEARKRVKRFKSLFHFCREVDHRALNKRVLENLIQAGAMDSFGVPRWDLMETMEIAINLGSKYQAEKKVGLSVLFDDGESEVEKYKKGVPWEKIEIYHREKKSLGFYLSGHPLSEKASLLNFLTTNLISELKYLDDNEEVSIGGVITNFTPKKDKKEMKGMCDIELEDMEGTVDIRIYGNDYEKYSKYIEKNSSVLVVGTYRKYEGGNRVIANAIVPLDKAKEILRDYISEVVITIPITLIDSEILEKLKMTILSHKGDTLLKFIIEEKKDDKIYFEVTPSEKYRVEPSDELIREIDELLGKNKIKLRFRIKKGFGVENGGNGRF